MTKKERTIKAIETLIEFYDKNDGRMSECPLCDIHLGFFPWGCEGCPSADWYGEGGCYEFESFNHGSTIGTERKAFWEKYLPIIKKWPTSRFTRKGWTYSGDEISRKD